LAASLARPGGNVTGVVILATELDGKRLDLLREAVPQARRIAALLLPSAPLRPASEREMREVAASTGVELLPFDAGGPEDYPAAFTADACDRGARRRCDGQRHLQSRCGPDRPISARGRLAHSV
jgi:putative ABC transport system substrate-binding protein